MTDPATARTLLFVPGDRPDRFPKAAAAGADLVVIDLEDAVAAEHKDRARRHAVEWLADGHRCAVRINGLTETTGQDDLAALDGLTCPVMVPKAEDPLFIADQLQGHPTLALIETAQGIVRAAEMAACSVVRRLVFGSFDLAAQLGVDPEDRDALSAARSALVLASAAVGLAAPVDGVSADVADVEALTDDIRYARRLGFTAKLCIHPAQVAPAATALTPSDSEISWAERVLAAAAGASVTTVDGRMVDKPVIDRARGLLAHRRG